MSLRSPKTLTGNKGSALLAALCFCAVLGIALASYMGVCYQALQTSSRNNNSTHSLELAETGIEEALWALNQKDNNTWAAAGWSLNNLSTPKVAAKTLDAFAFGNGVTGAVAIEIENYDGFVDATDSPATNGPRTIKVSGVTTMGDGTTVTRRLEIKTQEAPLFVNAVAALNRTPSSSGGAQISGISAAEPAKVTSFDSSPALLPGEDADQQTRRESYTAVVSSFAGVMLGNTNVQGYVAAAAKSNGAASLITWSSRVEAPPPLQPGQVPPINPARLSSNPYQPVFDIMVPTETGTDLPEFPLPSTAVTLGTPGSTTDYFRASDVNLTGTQTLTVRGPVVIVISGDFTMSVNAQIIVKTGGSLQIVLAGPPQTPRKLRIGGDGILNETGRAKNVGIFAKYPLQPPEDASPGAATISTLEDFCGVLYAPESDVSINSPLVFKGAIVGKNVLISGRTASKSLSYDLDLRKPTTTFSTIATPLTVKSSSWKEIPNP